MWDGAKDSSGMELSRLTSREFQSTWAKHILLFLVAWKVRTGTT